ncbi:MAG: ABC transporter permease [Betaproteobacteria bacterium]|nr:ABC transporter permease [Betaproteobacteria bacterium]
MIFTIASKDLKSMFASPLAWVVLTLVQLAAGFLFFKRLDDFLQVQPQLVQMASPQGFTELVAVPMFYAMAGLIMLIAIPLLAMRLFAEERRNQTMVLLTSAPVSMTDIVLGKFVALMGMLLIIFALIALMPLSLAATTRLDYRFLAVVILGLTLLAAALGAVSLYVSTLTGQPIIAAIGAFGAMVLLAVLGDQLAGNLEMRGLSVLAALAQVFSPVRNFATLSRGVIDSYAVACLLLLALVFLALTVRQLEARRLRGRG